MNTIRYYKGRRITFNPVNRLWWFKITDDDGSRVERCRHTLRAAIETIEQNLKAHVPSR